MCSLTYKPTTQRVHIFVISKWDTLEIRHKFPVHSSHPLKYPLQGLWVEEMISCGMWLSATCPPRCSKNGRKEKRGGDKGREWGALDPCEGTHHLSPLEVFQGKLATVSLKNWVRDHNNMSMICYCWASQLSLLDGVTLLWGLSAGIGGAVLEKSSQLETWSGSIPVKSNKAYSPDGCFGEKVQLPLHKEGEINCLICISGYGNRACPAEV